MDVLTRESVDVALIMEVGNGAEFGSPDVSSDVCTDPVVFCVIDAVAVCTADVVKDVNELLGILVVVDVKTAVVVEIAALLEVESIVELLNELDVEADELGDEGDELDNELVEAAPELDGTLVDVVEGATSSMLETFDSPSVLLADVLW